MTGARTKSPQAFRTIGEVAETLDTPTHVLRFWESRFPEISPVKRAGGRRYYRPDDIALLAGIKKLLHDDGITIRGVQKILQERGPAHVAAKASDEAAPDTRSAAPVNDTPQPPARAKPYVVSDNSPKVRAEQLARLLGRLEALRARIAANA